MIDNKASLTQLLEAARENELRFDWASAADDYVQALSCVEPKDFFEIGKVHEARANALFRFAFQAEDRKDFVARLKSSIFELDEARNCYERSEEGSSAARKLRCLAQISYSNLWMTSVGKERKRHADETWDLARKALDEFRSTGERLEFVRTLNAFSPTAQLAYMYSDDIKNSERIVDDALRISEVAMEYAPNTGMKEEVAKAYSNSALFTMYKAFVFSEIGERGRLFDKAWDWLRKSFETSRETTVLELSSGWLAAQFPPELSEEEVNACAREALEISRKTQDRLATGCALEWLHFRTAAKTGEAVDPDVWETLLGEALAYAERARKEFSVIYFPYPLMGVSWSGAPRAGYYAHLARLESNLVKKREYAEKGLEASPEEFKAVAESGIPLLVPGPHWNLALILTNLAKTEKDVGKKKEILAQAMTHINEFMSAQGRLYPHDVWFDGAKGFLAESEYEAARIASDGNERLMMMHQAIKHMKENIDGLRIDPYITSMPWESAWLADYLYQLGKWYVALSSLSGRRDDLSNAVSPFEESRAISERMGWPNRAAESCWQLAQVHDVLEDHSSSSEWFSKAAGLYSMAAEKVPRLNGLFSEHQSYMNAWAEIEQARHHYARHQSGASQEHFSKAADLLASTKKWSYLSSYYRAWSELERAEQLSRSVSIGEAFEAFHKASALFEASRSSLATTVARVEELDEKTMTESLIAAAEWRKSYCEGRAMLEDARIVGRKGDMSASAEKFESATKAFHGISAMLKDEKDRKEIQLIETLSKAWYAMTKAEAEASADLYSDASRYFEEARELSSLESEKLLVMGHSRFCKALAAGIKFEDTEDPALHSNATQQLESAAKFYMKAGNEDASEYADGSKLLFDAYMYMSKARKEDDLDKKAKLYVMAEKVLQASATSFEKSKHAGKRDEVVKMLGKVKRDRELAVSLGETLKAPDTTSSTAAFSVPTPTYEKATGIERFDHADVQATLVAKPKDLHVGEEMSVDIELVNAGRGSAQLMKVEEVIPKEFDIVKEPERYRIEDSYLNLKGKRLDALKTEDVRVVLKSNHHGRFTLRPRILYIDESGKYRSYEPEAVEVSVTELGISGWLKGPDKR